MIATERQRADHAFVGRSEELDFLERLTSGRLPSLTFIHGIGGLGKTRLLDVFSERRRANGSVVVRIDSSEVEPTEAGFFRALGHAAGGDIDSLDAASLRLGTLAAILVVDEIDSLRMLDTWLRRAFIPRLPNNVHVIFSGRQAPLPPWLQMPWRGEFRILELGPLDERDAFALLALSGIEGAQASRVNRVARGHPLALTLAATTLRKPDDPALEDAALHRIVETLSRRHLADIGDPLTRRAVEAASVARSVTIPLLAAMLPDVAPGDAYERLCALPLVRASRDSLQLHDTVRDAIAGELHTSDPPRYLAYRRACWARLTRDLNTASASELWRHTADLLFLLENPVVREAFFPSGAQGYAVEPARQSDRSAILQLMERHDGTEAALLAARWWQTDPSAFHVARDRNGEIAGMHVLFSADGSDGEDPLVACWHEHLRKSPVAPHERVLFLRRWLSRECGERPCAVQAALWLDIKRAYMANRPFLRRVYLPLNDIAPYAAAATRLGFRVLDACTTTIGGRSYSTAMLDFGPASVDGWFSRLVADELGIVISDLLDVGSRELVVGSRRSALTPREFDTFHVLIQHSGNVVHREELLAEVWGADSDVGSNVVDVVMRSLRKKLGERSAMIETVSGIGYRLRR